MEIIKRITLLFIFLCTITISAISQQDTSLVYDIDEAPGFPGGEEARSDFLIKNLRYPKLAKKNGIAGTVYVTFIVETDGNITNAKILRGIGGGCDEEVIRLTEKMPKWIPAKAHGKSVRVQFRMPVQFSTTKEKTYEIKAEE